MAKEIIRLLVVIGIFGVLSSGGIHVWMWQYWAFMVLFILYGVLSLYWR